MYNLFKQIGVFFKIEFGHKNVHFRIEEIEDSNVKNSSISITICLYPENLHRRVIYIKKSAVKETFTVVYKKYRRIDGNTTHFTHRENYDADLYKAIKKTFRISRQLDKNLMYEIMSYDEVMEVNYDITYN
jgi:hypothetical protein